MIRKIALLSTLLAVTGCAHLSTETIAEESVWQAENVVDFMQTTQISRQPWEYREIGTMSPFTGPHPSEGQVIGFSALFGVAHFATTEAIQCLAPNEPWLQRTWQFSGLAWKTNVILSNKRQGLSFTTRF
jgi:hypothetical protein